MKCEICGDKNGKMRMSSISPYVSEGLCLCDKCHKKGLIPYDKLVNFITNYEFFSDIPKEVKQQINKIISFYNVDEQEFSFDVAYKKALNYYLKHKKGMIQC